MGAFALKTLEFDRIKEKAASKAATFLGKEKVLSLQVTKEFAVAKGYLTETDEAIRLLSEGKKFPFGGADDITTSVKRAQIGGISEPRELLDVLNTLVALRSMKTFLRNEIEMAPTLSEYGNQLGTFAKLERQLDTAISEKGEIKDSASTKLAGLRTGIMVAKNRVKEKLDSILHAQENQKFFQEQLVTMRGDRYVIPIKQEYRFNFPGVVHDESGSGATLFIEPMAVVNLNNDIKKYMTQEKEEIERILRQLAEFIGNDSAAILSSLEIFTNVDAICAKALLAIEQHAVRPMLLVDGYVEISKGRHPLLATDKVVPIDINVGNTFNTLLITGPNTGGKTVALKTVGLFALMAQCGLFVPARFAKLPVFNAVYADIGDEQSIEQSLSTFSGHLRNIVDILAVAKAKDLVLIDEICAGTDPNEGAALAMAMLNYLHNKGVLTIITTHYSELKTFAFEQHGMENASVEFDPVTLSPTYRILMGVPGSSNAFYISEKLGLPKNIIDNAATMLKQEHRHMEDILQNLDVERRQYESQNKEIEVLKTDALKLKQDLVREKTILDKRKQDILRKAREEADEIYREAKRETTSVLKELKTLKNEFNAEKYERMAREAKEKLTRSFDFSLMEQPPGERLQKNKIQVGQSVYLPSLAQRGVITEVVGEMVTVQVGMMKTTVPLEKCWAVAASKNVLEHDKSKTRKNYAHKLFVKKSEEITNEVDVRGKTVEEAIPIIEKFIDDGLLSGMTKLRIIHGKGTGMLRAGLNKYFTGHRNIKAIELAPPEEGGSGATILFL
ncbi:MAG TPA: endonuclease MutS2 [Candidatus Avacidaminococcus intestinavium]|uniref:Endonuclease MutS2 n=1 Tax=Candidatus Avacidaminococcus intestinavium TaxID=2840684 RepID=A0A9D1MQ16_9FIRM|nr:endonuclease MutS2 [Candidatus Avacidaminococcus intestinavium]